MHTRRARQAVYAAIDRSICFVEEQTINARARARRSMEFLSLAIAIYRGSWMHANM